MKPGVKLALWCALLGTTFGSHAATFEFRYIDAAGEGFNDPTLFTPVGGNNATTLGAARRNVLQEAGRIWGALLISNVPIVLQAAFNPGDSNNLFTCTPNSATLAQAGTTTLFRDFPGAPLPNVFYAAALADALAARNLIANPQMPAAADIEVTVNSDVDSDPLCLQGRKFYYGLDHNKGNGVDALTVLLHELAHGFGFFSEVDVTTGEGLSSTDGVPRFTSYVQFVFDEQFNQAWPLLSNAERMQSAVRTGSLAWNGTNVNAQLSRFSLGATPNGRLRLNAPATASMGSSVSHWDPITTPNILMEPNISRDLLTNSTDVTVCALRDIGWQTTRCPDRVSNTLPMAIPQTVALLEDTSATITLTGADADNDVLSFAITAAPARGTLSAISTTLPRTVTYIPNADVNGADSFSFTVNDGAGTSAPAVVTLNITAAPTAPAPAPAPRGGGGGGSMAYALLLLLAGIAILRARATRSGRIV